MDLTSSMCRAQEAVQRDRAANASLENVRIVAERAAIAWAQEAIEAERREDRRARTRAIAQLVALQKQRSHSDDHQFSENPDRGLAHS
jgi:hypothetical protein